MSFPLTNGQLEKLAADLITDCCIIGIRNSGGRYQNVSDAERLHSRVRALIAKSIRDSMKETVVEQTLEG